MTVTRLDRKRQAVLQAQKLEAVGRLAGGVAHDFNNLLTIIQSFGELIQDDLPSGSPSLDYVNEILNASAKARDLTRQLLAFSRRQTLSREVTTLNHIVLDAQRLLERAIGESIEMNIRLSDEPWPINVDPGHFCQVLLNLVLNARDALPRGGAITIETRNLTVGAHGLEDVTLTITPADYASISVGDTGSGISTEVLPHIFEPFYTTKTRTRGTGLGLATCHGIVNQSKGYIWASNQVEAGAVFHVLVPKTDLPLKPRIMHTPPPPPRGDNELVLVVEDDDRIRSIMLNALSSYGYRAIAAPNGLSALEAARPLPNLDLVVTDIVMPHLNGPDLIHRLRKKHPNLPALFVSGYNEETITRQAPLSPGEALLKKPFSRSELLLSVRDVLDRRSTPYSANVTATG